MSTSLPSGLIEQVARELERLSKAGWSCSLTLSPQAALTLCAQLQLALRHHNNGPAAQAARYLVLDIRQWFTRYSPMLDSILTLGDTEDHVAD